MVRFRAGLGLGLGLTVDTQIGTIMTINEDPSPNLIGRQVDRSTSRQVDRSTSRQVDNSVLVLFPIMHLDPVRVRVRLGLVCG